MNHIRTPCIGICSTTSFGDRICRGCKRFGFEVINWNTYSEAEKRAVMSRIQQFTDQLMMSRFRIFSVQRLQDAMMDFRFFHDPALSPYCWLHGLLQKHLHRISTLQEIGVALQTAYAGRDLRDILDELNEELIVLSEAHYERYFQRC
ncbi:MAG: DUF1289 domain-containing protein [Pseudomonadales bacterium]|nr:DUF1289 domain-containing protein [Pseudomonadales bacterium]